MGRFFVVVFVGNLDRKFVFLFHKSVFCFVAFSCRNACIYWELLQKDLFFVVVANIPTLDVGIALFVLFFLFFVFVLFFCCCCCFCFLFCFVTFRFVSFLLCFVSFSLRYFFRTQTW